MTLPSLRRAGLFALAALLGACGGSSPPPSKCPNTTPDTCPATRPTFAADAQPVFQSLCGACHVAGGVESSRPMQTWTQISGQKQDIFLQISFCIMPPADQPQPTEAQRQAIMGWIVCGANDD